MQRLIKGCIAGLVLGIASSAVLAQPATTAPATTQSAPKKIDMPKGFEKVVVNNITVLCEPNDKAWIQTALKEVKTPKPIEGGPKDMLDKLKDNRAGWVKNIATDLGIDEKKVNDFLDDKVVTQLKNIESLKPPIYFMITTDEKLKNLCKTTGWGEPKFHYARHSDRVFIDDQLTISIDKPMDEQILVAFYDPSPEAKEADRIKGLTNGVERLQAGIQGNVANMSVPAVFAAFSTWIDKEQFEPLKLRRDQSWLSVGVTNVLSSKYAGLITGVNKNNFLQRLLAVPQEVEAIFNFRAVNLLNPLDPEKNEADKKSMNPLVVPYYNLAMQRKSILVVLQFIEDGGETVIPKALKAVRDKKPTDGKALVAAIKDATGIDLTKNLEPR